MTAVIPSWFHADQIYASGECWFVGSQDSLHIGPYPDREQAQTKSEQFAKRMKKMLTDGERLRYVRKLLADEWAQIGPSAHLEVEEICMEATQDPVRQGEEHRHWYRSNRYFQVDGIWFFSTREGIDVGPFVSEGQARHHEQRLKSRLIRAEGGEEARRIIMEYKHNPERPSADSVRYEGMRQFHKRG